MSVPGIALEKAASLRDDAEGITSGLNEAHSIVDSLTGMFPAVSASNPPSDSIVGELQQALQNNRALVSNLVKRLLELKAKF